MAAKRGGWLSRHALALWFMAIATLGFMRWWMKVEREAGSAQAPDAILWLAGSIVMAAIGLVALWRSH